MARIVIGAVILTLCMVSMAALTAFLMLVYSRMKDDMDSLRSEKGELEERIKKLSAENLAFRLGRINDGQKTDQRP